MRLNESVYYVNTRSWVDGGPACNCDAWYGRIQACRDDGRREVIVILNENSDCTDLTGATFEYSDEKKVAMFRPFRWVRLLKMRYCHNNFRCQVPDNCTTTIVLLRDGHGNERVQFQCHWCIPTLIDKYDKR